MNFIDTNSSRILFSLILFISFHLSLTAQNFSDENIIDDDVNQALYLLAEDIDYDGDVDIIAISNDKLVWYANDGSGNFSSPNTITTEVLMGNKIIARDINSDGYTDLIAASVIDAPVKWYANDGNGNFSEGQIVTDYTSLGVIAAGDYTGNGEVDVVYLGGSWIYDDLVMTSYNPSGYFVTQFEFSNDLYTPERLYNIDMDNDGDLDVVAWFSGTGKIAVYINNSGSFNNPQTIDPGLQDGPDRKHIESGDIDMDGDMDILYSSFVNNKVLLLENLGSGDFSDPIEITTEVIEPECVALGDIDNDGDLDLVTASAADDKVAYQLGNGDGSFQDQVIISTNADWATFVLTADVDGDGKLDVVSSSIFDNKIVWYANQFAVGVKEIVKPISFVYPNPSDTYVVLEGVFDGKVMSISFTDVKGAVHKVNYIKQDPNSIQCDVSSLVQGQYVVTINCSDFIAKSTIIIN